MYLNWAIWIVVAFSIGLALCGVRCVFRHGLYLRVARLVERLLELSELVLDRIQILPRRIGDNADPSLAEEEVTWIKSAAKAIEEEAVKTSGLPQCKWFWYEKDIQSIGIQGREIARKVEDLGVDAERVACIEWKNKELIDEKGKFKGFVRHWKIDELRDNVAARIKKLILKGEKVKWFVDDEGKKWSFDDAELEEFKKAKEKAPAITHRRITPDKIPLEIKHIEEKRLRVREATTGLPGDVRRFRDLATIELARAAAFFAVGSLIFGLFAILRVS